TCSNLPRTRATTAYSSKSPEAEGTARRSSAALVHVRAFARAATSRSPLTRAHSTSSTRTPGSGSTTGTPRKELHEPHSNRRGGGHHDAHVGRRRLRRGHDRASRQVLERERQHQGLDYLRRHLDG